MTTSPPTSLRVEPSPKRIRVEFGGEIIADSTAAKLVWEIPWYPQYYLPRADVATDRLVAEEPDGPTHEHLGQGRYLTLETPRRRAEQAAWYFPAAPRPELRDHIRFDWATMDAWFEEDEEIFVHPRDPYSRIDILPSSRHVVIVVDGVTVADSTRPYLLFETGLPTRYYLPKTDLRRDLLEPSDLVTQCPYKGDAQYYSLRMGDTQYENLFWYYDRPVAESTRIAGLVSFYDERVELFLDGERA